jgi:hypothetical protein
MVRAGLMEKIMSKSSDSSKLGRATQVRELRDDELENVSGGAVNIERLDTTITTTDSGLIGPDVVNVLIKSILGVLNNQANNQARMG